MLNIGSVVFTGANKKVNKKSKVNRAWLRVQDFERCRDDELVENEVLTMMSWPLAWHIAIIPIPQQLWRGKGTLNYQTTCLYKVKNPVCSRMNPSSLKKLEQFNHSAYSMNWIGLLNGLVTCDHPTYPLKTSQNRVPKQNRAFMLWCDFLGFTNWSSQRWLVMGQGQWCTSYPVGINQTYICSVSFDPFLTTAKGQQEKKTPQRTRHRDQ